MNLKNARNLSFKAYNLGRNYVNRALDKFQQITSMIFKNFTGNT